MKERERRRGSRKREREKEPEVPMLYYALQCSAMPRFRTVSASTCPASLGALSCLARNERANELLEFRPGRPTSSWPGCSNANANAMLLALLRLETLLEGEGGGRTEWGLIDRIGRRGRQSWERERVVSAREMLTFGTLDEAWKSQDAA